MSVSELTRPLVEAPATGVHPVPAREDDDQTSTPGGGIDDMLTLPVFVPENKLAGFQTCELGKVGSLVVARPLSGSS
jgi:hypothetical protein